MVSVYELKPKFQDLLRPVCKGLAARGVRPNQVTWAAMGLSLLSGIWIAVCPESRWPLLWVPMALFLRMALNAVDGMLAREHDMKTRAGALLNEAGDVASDAVLYLPFALVPGLPAAWVVGAVVLAGLTEVVGLAAVGIGAPRGYQGPMGKSDRAAVFGLLAFLLGLGVPTGGWALAVFTVMNVLMLVTVWNRARSALKAEAP
jgi:CDP-diacylglycerol--glycerol-3-phosphate 3-phosphatidyltransferase